MQQIRERQSERRSQLDGVVVTAQQMREIESRIFAAGMPVSALMEKVGGLIAERIQTLYPLHRYGQVGILVGPGHNGGDALVVARELFFQGYDVQICRPLPRSKALTEQHAQYAQAIGIPFVEHVEALETCDVLVDGLFGFGLERSLTGSIAELVDRTNHWPQAVLSIDLPSGLHTDTGAVLGTAIQATHTLCLGLWKLGLLQDQALAYGGTIALIDFDIPLADIRAVLGNTPTLQRITPNAALAHIPLSRPLTTHKYRQGHLLLIGGSQRYAGSIVLAGLGARATGVGMLSIAVPVSLKAILVSQLPEALIIACPETTAGTIAQLPDDMQLDAYDAIAYGPGMTTETCQCLQQLLASDRPLILDADGLNQLAQLGTVNLLKPRQTLTVLTPHEGEFKRLFPHISLGTASRVDIAQQAAAETGAVLLLKGARTVIASSQGIAINPNSTPALARGGSGDVLTGLLGGLLAQAICGQNQPEATVRSAVWWHAQAGIHASEAYTELGVDAVTLAQCLIPALKASVSHKKLSPTNGRG